MLDVDEIFARKCRAFSVGDTQTVADSLTDCSHVIVGAMPLHFQEPGSAKAVLDNYREGLVARGYAHSFHTLKEITQKGTDQALVTLTYTHLDWQGREIDTLEASYILAKDHTQEWKCFFVEFPTEPVAFSAMTEQSNVIPFS